MTAILKQFPYSFESERLLIRGPLPGDGQAVYTAVAASQNELKQWMPWAMELPTPEQYEARVRHGQLRFLAREDLWLLLFLKENNSLVGCSGLHNIDWGVPKFEIGYWLHSAYVGHGYMTEAVAAITDFAFSQLGANRVEIRCDSANGRSAAIPRRLQFSQEATLYNDERHHLTQQLRHTYVFAKTTAVAETK